MAGYRRYGIRLRAIMRVRNLSIVVFSVMITKRKPAIR